MDWLTRTELLLGPERLERLRRAHVVVVGLGGVGGCAAEMICRAGVGKLTIADGDRIEPSNINRQIPATRRTIGRGKADAVAERLREIHPEVDLRLVDGYLDEDAMGSLLSEPCDFVVDAIDTLAPKIGLIRSALVHGRAIVSSMGAGGRTDPGRVRIADLADSFGCPLARALRKRLHQEGIRTGFPVVFSSEPVPAEAVVPTVGARNKKSNVGTISYMPALFGCFCASAVIRGLGGDGATGPGVQGGDASEGTDASGGVSGSSGADVGTRDAGSAPRSTVAQAASAGGLA